jgi:hypothetical protein
MWSKTPFAALLAAPILLAAAGGAMAVGPTNEPFCETSKQTGLQVCEYRTLEQCQAAIKGRDATCGPNPNAPTR